MAPGLLNTNDTPRLGCEERDDDRVYCAGRRDVYGCSGFRFCVLSFNPITNRSASSSVARCRWQQRATTAARTAGIDVDSPPESPRDLIFTVR